MPPRKPRPNRVADLEDQLKERDRRLADLKRDLDVERDLTQRLDEHLRDASDMIEQWKQAFDMVLNEEGLWVWDSSFAQGEQWLQKYQALLREWNAFVPDYNAVVRPRNVGRPLAASEAQCDQVRKLRKAGASLRGIAEETNLTLTTVRTIVDQADGVDRTTRKHLARIDPDRAAERQWRSKSQGRKVLPKRIAAWEETAAELRKEVKGLK
jgi:hypothetical protein